MQREALRIGTSGWAYDDWKGPFYPAGIGRDAMLAEYARHFDAVELNATFYRLPAAATLERWAASVPDGFAFAVKASRYITHVKKLRDSADTLAPFLERIRVLDDRLGPVLFQLPPRFRYNGARLGELLGNLPADLDCAFEFRDASWLNDDCRRRLSDHGAALCLHDLGGSGTAGEPPAGSFAYVRLHGPGEAYAGRYGEGPLDAWAERLGRWAGDGMPAWCFFDNDAEANAPADALRLRERLVRMNAT